MKRYLFYLFWFFLSCIQAFATELFDDEAYYWVYSKYLDWGYFDHPPMIAWLIKAGSFLMPGELGVRLLVVLLGTATIACIEYLTHPKNLNLFYGIILGVAILQIGSFIAVPDIPLLFFTSVFFIAYQNFLKTLSWSSALGLSISIVLLLYSKYHGLLIIVFTLLSNIRLLQKPQIWFIILSSIFLYWPHCNWQLNHALPSLQYHIYERLSTGYRINFTFNYFLGQLLITGPFIGWLIIWAALKSYPKQPLQKAMYWSIVGTYLIFFVCSFRSRIEANWTIEILTPLIVLAYPAIESNLKWTNWVIKTLPVTLLLVLAFRVYMILDLNPVLPKDEYHKNKEWISKVKSSSKGRPVVFTNSYQRASKYSFYTGDTAFSLMTYRYRRSNYNIWPIEERFFGEDVFLVGAIRASIIPNDTQSMHFTFDGEYISSFRSFSRISFTSLHKLQVNENRWMDASLKIDAVSQSVLDSAIKYRPQVMIMIYPTDKSKPIVILPVKRLLPDYTNVLNFRIRIPDSIPIHNVHVRFGIENSFKEPTINSIPYPLGIKATQ